VLHENTSGVQPPPRHRLSEAEKQALVRSHSDVQTFQQIKRAEALAVQLPESCVTAMLGGELGRIQVPDPAERHRDLVQALRHCGGPDGASLDKAKKALERLRDFATARGIPDGGLPASGALVATLLAEIDAVAKQRARGSQGGSTVAASTRTGLLFLKEHLGIPIDVGATVAEAAAPPGRKCTRERQAGSIPLKVVCHLERLAVAHESEYVRTYSRSLLVTGVHASLRMVDVLRASIAPQLQQMVDGSTYFVIDSKFSKDGDPITVFVPARGFLGPFTWAEEYLAEWADSGFVLGAFEAARGHAGDIRFASGWLNRVVPKPHAIKSLKALLALPPLSMSSAEFAELGLTGHSMHGSPSDWAATIGPQTPPGLSFGPACENELGHRRRRTRQGGELVRVDTAGPDAAFETAEAAADHAMLVS
jgi:hypothetical protein